ncbi:hypothetical protein KY313_02230 [Candidatus Woesearchaeota archaeon]|nr:hypothetical protein [Candidatus Woesearchaeota archaeon]
MMKNKNNSINLFYFGNKKSQSVVIDLFIALFVFILIMSIITIMWNRYNLDLNQKITQKDMWLKAYHITDLLVESQGNPIDWEINISNISYVRNHVSSIGLVNLDRQLSLDKVEAFKILSNSTNYNITRELLNIEGFEFYFTLFHSSGLIFESGNSPIFYGDLISGRTTTIRRYVSFEECNENKCILEFSLWEWE